VPDQKTTSYVIVTGGVCSSLGKGIAAASLARLLRDGGHRVRNIKCDPYLNVDPGTLRPGEHGEVFVTADGGEGDLDFGTYERFSGVDAVRDDSITAGSCYWSVLGAERRGDLLGSTVQAVPHLTDEILRRVRSAAARGDVVIVELGGTVGDIEVQIFLEAFRQLRAEHPGRVVNIHLTLVPEVGPAREPKTKPTQHSVTELRRHGLSPDILLARSSGPLDDAVLAKLRATCGVPVVLSAPDVDSIYGVPELFAAAGLDVAVAARLGLAHSGRRPGSWSDAAARIGRPDPSWPQVNVALVGKYTGYDTYVSVLEALRHAAAHLSLNVAVETVDADGLDAADPSGVLGRFDAVVVPGGFGLRGLEGKISAAAFCREQDVPYLGLCLGLQVAVIDACRAGGIADAVSAEWQSAGTEVISLMDDQGDVVSAGGTMRLGERPSRLETGSFVAGLYGSGEAVERHRHRYEVNPAAISAAASGGLVVSGRDRDAGMVEFVERPGARFFVATQAHPEFISRPDRPHPLFVGLLAAARS